MKTYIVDENNPPNTELSRGYSPIVSYVRDWRFAKHRECETKMTLGWSGVDHFGGKLCFVPDGTTWISAEQ